MSYKPPVDEQRFLLAHVVGIDELSSHFPSADSETVDAVIAALADFAVGEIEPLGAPADRQGACWTSDGVITADGYKQAYRALVEGGWMSLTGPEEFGGQAMPLTLATLLMEDMCSSDMAFSLCSMLSFGTIDALEAHGSETQKAQWLPKLVSGEWTGTMNLTEPQAGSDVGALKSSAVRQPDGRYKIKGQKIFITYGDHDLTDNIVHMVLARTPDAPEGTKGISLFLVPKYRLDADGKPGEANDVRCASIEHKMGIHGSPTCVMLYGEDGDCFGEIVGVEGGGMRAMFTMMNAARLQVGLQGVAAAEAATQHAVAYAMERVQSARAGSPSRDSVPIIQHPDVRRMLLRMKALTMGARALVYAATGMADRAKAGIAGAQVRVDLLTPLAKAWGTDVGCEVASLGVQVHGGMGFIEETGAARYYRDVRIAPIYEGTNGIQAADLVNRKLGLDGGAAFASLLADLRTDADGETTLLDLISAIEKIAAGYSDASIDDRLAGSYPLLTMLSVATAGGLLARQIRAAGEGTSDFLVMKRTAARYFLNVIVPEASGLAASATAGAALLYSCGDGCFAGA